MLITVVWNLSSHMEYVNSDFSPILMLISSEWRDGRLASMVISYNMSNTDQKIQCGVRLIE